MPAPAPAATSVIFCEVVRSSDCENAEPSAEPIWMIGPSRPTAAPVPIDSAEASVLMTATRPRMLPRLVEDRVHHFGHAMALGLRREAAHQKHDDQAAEHGGEEDPVAEAARPFENIGVVNVGEPTEIAEVVDQPDQSAQRDRANSRGDPDANRQQAEKQKVQPGFAFGFVGTRRGGSGGGRNSHRHEESLVRGRALPWLQFRAKGARSRQ